MGKSKILKSESKVEKTESKVQKYKAPKKLKFKCLSKLSASEKRDKLNWELKNENDPGIFISYKTDEEIHAALLAADVLPAGLLLGVTAAGSALNLKNWVVTQAISVPTTSPLNRVTLSNGELSTEAFHHFTPTQYLAFVNRLSTDVCIAWSAACIAGHVSAGKMYAVFGSGGGSCDMGQVRVGSFNN